MTDKAQILEAIKNQRWFFFKNNENILFDRGTGLIWANLNHFQYGKDNNTNLYSGDRNYAEVQALIRETNEIRFGGLNDWRVPNPNELWNLVEDRTFPFVTGSNWLILNRYIWCVERSNGDFASKDLSNRGAFNGIRSNQRCCVIPCSSTFLQKGFIATPLKILNFFADNNLIPMFNDKKANELYEKVFIRKEAEEPPKPVKVDMPAKPVKSEIKLTAKFNYKPILEKYDTDELAASPIKYFNAVSDVADTFLDVLQNYETAHSEVIGEFSQSVVMLGVRYVNNPHLDAAENSLLEERQKFLARQLKLGTDDVKTQILLLKEQAKNFSERLDEINHSKNSVRELAALEAEPRVSFAFLVENAARLIQNAQMKMDFFILNKKFVAFVVNAWESWSNDYKIFKTSLHEELIAGCRAADVDEKIFGKWYEEWRGKRFLIEQRLLPLIEFALKGHLLSQDDKPSVVEETLKALRDYKDSLDKFYLNERKSIYQKFAFTAGSDLLEKFETESELYKQTEKFQREWQKIIFSCDKTEDRIFLLKWAEPLLNLSVNAIVDFLEERQLDTMTEKILSQFAALRRQSSMSPLADSAAFAKASQQREKETTQLFFRMRKGLRK